MRIIQHSIDGLGHQLHGLFSVMLLHNTTHTSGLKYYFDSIEFARKDFSFAHLDEQTSAEAQRYIVEIAKAFTRDTIIKPHHATGQSDAKVVHVHELDKVTLSSHTRVLHSIDNAYYFDKLRLSIDGFEQHIQNRHNFKKYFVNEYLPPNRLSNDVIVFHIRQGDALKNGYRHNKMSDHLRKTKVLLNRMSNEAYAVLLNLKGSAKVSLGKAQFASHISSFSHLHVYIHTDGNEDYWKKFTAKHKNVRVFGKETSVLQALSDFIYAKVLVCGTSSLSKVCAFLGDDERTVIIPDNTRHIPESENVIGISKFLKRCVSRPSLFSKA